MSELQKPTDWIRRYFEYIDTGQFERATGLFAADFERRIRGRTITTKPRMLSQLEDRGLKEYDHDIVHEVNDGNEGAVHGRIVNDPAVDRTFVAYCKITDGKMSLYTVGVNERRE